MNVLIRIAAGLVAFIALHAFAAERTIFSSEDARVSLGSDFDCIDEKANIRIESASPEIFVEGSKRIQTLVDSTQAVLRYECPGLNEINIDGYMLGLDQPVYAAVSKGSQYWQVASQKVISQTEAKQATEALESNPDAYAGILDSQREISIASIHLDMTVEEVENKIVDVFGSNPDYSVASGIMKLELGGCPANYYETDFATKFSNLSAEWTCVKGWFTDRRIARLYGLNYTQVSTSGMKAVKNALIDHFGEPVVDQKTKNKKGHKLVWQAENQDHADRLAIEQLEARFRKSRGLVIIDLFLGDPEIAAQYAKTGGAGTKKSKLKL